MYYITVKQPPIYHQMTLEEFLFGPANIDTRITSNEANTRTYEVEKISERFKEYVSIENVIAVLGEFNRANARFREGNRHDFYREFSIPKKSGGFRKICAPNDDLMGALRRLKDILEVDCKALYHTSAFAYVKKRSTIDAVKKHQQNESRWFAKFDLSNFFGSTTLDFVLRMFGMIYPFCEIMKDPFGKEQLTQALELAFLDGGLPQGTPVSPTITNIMMIPVDFRLSKIAREKKFVYTRYADDFLISSKYSFEYKKVESTIIGILEEYDAGFSINKGKTRYGSSAGSNWNLGVMLNKDNKITIGSKRKRQFQAMLSSYIMDRKRGAGWDKEDIQIMEGYRNYYRMVERECIDGIIEHLNAKFGEDIVACIKQDLAS